MSEPIQTSEQTTEKFIEYLDGTNKILNDIMDIFNLNKITITFDSKLGTDVSPITYYKGQSYGVLPKPVRPGYDFAGWFKKYYKDIITERETYSEPVLDYDKVDFESNVTLYAKWTNAAIKVVLNPSTGTVYPEEIYVTYLSTFPSLPNPDLPLAKFQYWYGYPETSSIITEQTVLSTYDELEISARFNEEYCTLRYNPNGGTGTVPSNKPCRFNEVVSGDALTSINLTKPGYTAVGWSQSKNNPDIFLSNDTLDIWTDTEIWAYYEPNRYIVSYLSSEKTQDFIYGEAKELLTFDQAGITGEEEYKSWAYNPGGGLSTVYYEPGGLVCNLTENNTIKTKTVGFKKIYNKYINSLGQNFSLGTYTINLPLPIQASNGYATIKSPLSCALNEMNVSHPAILYLKDKNDDSLKILARYCSDEDLNYDSSNAGYYKTKKETEIYDQRKNTTAESEFGPDEIQLKIKNNKICFEFLLKTGNIKKPEKIPGIEATIKFKDNNLVLSYQGIRELQLSASTNPPNTKGLISEYPNCYDPFVWIGELNQKSTNTTRKPRKSPKNKKRSKK